MSFSFLISVIFLSQVNPLALPSKSSLPTPPLPFPSSYTVAEKAKSYLKYRRELINEGVLTSAPDSDSDDSPGVKSAGKTSNMFVVSLSLRPAPLDVPDVASSYYLERDVLDYGEMTALGFDNLVRDVMQVEGGRLAIYDELKIKPPSNPTKKKRNQGRSLELREEGWSGYGGLKLGGALEEDLVKADSPMEGSKEVPLTAKVLPETKNPESPFKPIWTANKLDEQGKVKGRAVSWARTMREERLLMGGRRADGSFDLFGVKVESGNQLWISAWAVWAALAFGQGEESWVSYAGPSVGPTIATVLKVLGLAGGAGWIGVGGKLLIDGRGVLKALVGPDFEDK
ncbi:hypothetical protein TrCOL_g209 [Triparma columacea]|uniref:Uncharacterized protein n=1 Tax=Triparma columacea TaxID=722753 RepID=A0A9W7GFV1_9STRA|nr:hypothetical protein TrCOL_g209 [Triparma columacea]